MGAVRRVLLALLVTIAVLVASLWVLQRRLIYLPAGAPPPVQEVLPGAEEVTLATADALELTAWYVPAGPTAAAVFPGNAGNRSHRAPLARALADLGLSVLLVDYRGYGGNPGQPSEEGLMIDAESAAAWLERRPEVERTVYVGESLGAAVAVEVAVRRPPDAVVLRSPFTSLHDVARVHYGPVPGWFLRDDFDAAERIGSLDAPVLTLAVEGDAIVPYEQSRRLHDAAGEPKRFVTLDAAGHNDPDLLDGTEFVNAVAAFLRDHDLLPDGR